MTNDEFNRVVAERLNKISSVLSKKAEEYASTQDRLHNFKVAAAIDSEAPERALWGMLKKHIVSVRDMVDGLDSMSCPNYALWDEKLGDTINYCILLEGLVVERIHSRLDSELQNETHG